MNWSIAMLQAANEGGSGIRGILKRFGENAIKLIESLTGAEQPTTTVYVDRVNAINVVLVVVLVVVVLVAGVSMYKNMQYRAIIKDLTEEEKRHGRE